MNKVERERETNPHQPHRALRNSTTRTQDPVKNHRTASSETGDLLDTRVAMGSIRLGAKAPWTSQGGFPQA